MMTSWDERSGWDFLGNECWAASEAETPSSTCIMSPSVEIRDHPPSADVGSFCVVMAHVGWAVQQPYPQGRYSARGRQPTTTHDDHLLLIGGKNRGD